MLAYARFRGAGGFLRARGEAEQAVLYRAAPLPPALRRAPLEDAGQAYDAGRARRRAGRAAAHAAAARPAPPGRARASRWPSASRSCAALLRRGTFSFDEAVGGADRMTVAVTLFALLELYKGGEADWEQGEPFGPITVRADRAGGGRVVSLGARGRGAALPRTRPGPGRPSSPTRSGSSEDDVTAALGELAAALDGRGIVLRELAGGWTLASHPDAEEPARRLLSRPRTPALTPAQAETLAIVAYLQPVSRPEMARIRGVGSESATLALTRARADRGGGPLAVRRRALPHHAALPQAVRPAVARRAARRVALGPEPGRAGRAARPAAARRRRAGGGRSAHVAGRRSKSLAL